MVGSCPVTDSVAYDELLLWPCDDAVAAGTCGILTIDERGIRIGMDDNGKESSRTSVAFLYGGIGSALVSVGIGSAGVLSDIQGMPRGDTLCRLVPILLYSPAGLRVYLLCPHRKAEEKPMKMKSIKHILSVILLLAIVLPMSATEEKSPVDVQEVLWGHIKDSYEWHVTDIGHTHITLHLPVIVKSSTGWHVFSSSKFAHEKDARGNRPGPYGLYISGGKQYPNKICEQVNGTEVRPLDISMTKTVCTLFIDAVLLLLCILIPARWCRKHRVTDEAPKGFIGLMHMFVMYVYDDIIKPTLKEDADKFAPYLLTCFFFIFTANIMGLIPFPPGGGNLTGNIACTFFLGCCTFIVTNVFGTKEYWKEIFWPDVPLPLKAPLPIIPFIEFFGIFTKPFALIVRLFANMMAGHAIALTFVCIIFIMFGLGAIAGTSMTIVSVGMSIFMTLLEVLVCLIQALVFTMLSAIFISLARVKHEHKTPVVTES